MFPIRRIISACRTARRRKNRLRCFADNLRRARTDGRVQSLPAGQTFFEPGPPRRRVIGRQAELDPRGAAAGDEVEALAVEAYRAPAPGLQDPGGGFVSGK